MFSFRSVSLTAVLAAAIAGCHRPPTWEEIEGPRLPPCGTPGTLELKHGTASGAASEVIFHSVSADNGAAVSEAIIALSGAGTDSLRAATDENGMARVKVGVGPYEVQVRRVGYERLKGAEPLRPEPGDTVLMRLAVACDRRDH